MARHYSTKSFFRNAPNALLARYFKERGVLTDFDFIRLKEGNPDPLFAVWLTLDEATRGPMDTDFQEIFALSCEKGIKTIIDDVKFLDPEDWKYFSEWLATKPNHYAQALAVFLDYPKYWRGAADCFHADNLSYWRKRKNMPKLPVRFDEASLRRLEQLIADYFHYTEGKGKNCLVEPLRRSGKDYFFAYPEDYSKRSIEWVKGEFKPRPHNPAFEIIFVYSQQEGTLDLHYPGNYKALEPLQSFFAEAILGVEALEPELDDNRIYDLSPFLDSGFSLVYSPYSGVSDIRVCKLRLSSKVKKGEKLVLEGDYQTDANAVYKLLERIAPTLPLDSFFVNRVEMVASVLVAVDKPPKTVRFTITHPNSCSLKYEAEHLLLRDMLEQSGIEPREAVF